MSLLEHTNFEACTKCTICTEYCPVSEATPVFPGPKQSGPDGERLRLKDAQFYDEALRHCTNCKRCEVACPSNVRIGDVIALARQRYGHRSFSLRDFLLSHTDFLGTLAATPLAPIINASTKLPPVKFLLDTVLGIPAKRRFPPYTTESFRTWFQKNARTQEGFSEYVTLFHGCFINYNNPSLGRDALTVLNALGVGVRLLEKERCCGVPLIAGGFFDDARKNALANAESLQKATKSGGKIVVPSSTCALTMREEYPHILEVDNSGWRNALDLLPRHIHRLLEGGKSLPLRPLNITVAYHTACHMERLGWAGYSIELLRRIPGITVRILPSQCCGIAGTYGFKQEYYATAQKIGASLFEDVRASGADVIVSECETCKMQIEMSTGIPCENPVTLLARSLTDPERYAAQLHEKAAFSR